MRGIVNDRLEAKVLLQIRGLFGKTQVEALIDTGYSSLVIVPISLVNELGLVLCGESRAELADGTITSFDFYSADLERDGFFENVMVSAAGEECLVGMQFLEGCELRIQAKPGGLVEITKL